MNTALYAYSSFFCPAVPLSCLGRFLKALSSQPLPVYAGVPRCPCYQRHGECVQVQCREHVGASAEQLGMQPCISHQTLRSPLASGTPVHSSHRRKLVCALSVHGSVCFVFLVMPVYFLEAN